MHPGQWTTFDLLFAGIVALSTLLALWKGIVREIVSLVALIAGFLLAVFFYPVPAARLIDFCRTEQIANLAGFLVIFLGTLLAGTLVSIALNRFLKAVTLKWADRFLGSIFGFLRGWAVCSILVLALIAFPVKKDLLSRSVLAPFLLGGASAAVRLTPQSLKDKFYTHYRKVLHSWNLQQEEP
ncbi:MAG: CvpA family protein [Acidobacteria bacterium]|jgi:membrane protein required for colicin V production|nr:CvpA family protein [Acidobacteriota bacterium]